MTVQQRNVEIEEELCIAEAVGTHILGLAAPVAAICFRCRIFHDLTAQ